MRIIVTSLLLGCAIGVRGVSAEGQQHAASLLNRNNRISPSKRPWHVSQRSAEVVVTTEAAPQSATTISPPLTRSSARYLLATCAALYGSTYPLTKMLQDALNPSMVTALRFSIAMLFFTPQLKRVFSDTGLLMSTIELGTWSSIGFISQAKVLSQTSASKAAFFGGLSVVMPPLFELITVLINHTKRTFGLQKHTVVLQKESSAPPRSLLARLLQLPVITPALALCGAAWLACGGFVCDGLGVEDLRLLITPASFALCFWRAADVGARFPNDTTAITAGMLMTMTAICSAWAVSSMVESCPSTVRGTGAVVGSVLHQMGEMFASINPLTSGGFKILLGLLYSSICATAFTSAAEQQAIRVVSAAEVTLIYAMEPLFATFLSWLIAREEVSKSTLIGACFIVLACMWDTIVSLIVV